MKQKATQIQLVFASLIQKFVVVDLVLLAAGFIVYVFGVVKPKVTPQRITQLWHLEASELLEKTGVEDGWGWVKNITSGDALSLATLVFLPCATIICLALILPLFVKIKDFTYTIIIILEIVILILTASGIFVA